MEIDPDEATREYKESIIGPYREIMPEDVIASIEENLSGACTTEMASFDRFIDFMGTVEYDVVVFDTAPTGHTLRLLDLPFDYARQVELMVDTSSGSSITYSITKERFEKIIDMLRDGTKTVFTLNQHPLKSHTAP